MNGPQRADCLQRECISIPFHFEQCTFLISYAATDLDHEPTTAAYSPIGTIAYFWMPSNFCDIPYGTGFSCWLRQQMDIRTHSCCIPDQRGVHLQYSFINWCSQSGL